MQVSNDDNKKFLPSIKLKNSSYKDKTNKIEQIIQD